MSEYISKLEKENEELKRLLNEQKRISATQGTQLQRYVGERIKMFAYADDLKAQISDLQETNAQLQKIIGRLTEELERERWHWGD